MELVLLPILIFLHILLATALFFISKIFKIRGGLIDYCFLNTQTFLKFLIKLSVILIFFFIIGFKFTPNLIQVINFLVSFILIFEVCIKIANSLKFINWIGESLEKTFRLLIMFVISLNCTYFFTRITHQIIKSNGF